jgi:hypothetical protein
MQVGKEYGPVTTDEIENWIVQLVFTGNFIKQTVVIDDHICQAEVLVSKYQLHDRNLKIFETILTNNTNHFSIKKDEYTFNVILQHKYESAFFYMNIIKDTVVQP